MPESLPKRMVAEFLGVLALCFIGILSIGMDGGLVAVAFAHGLIIAVMVAALGGISGGHFNPAVTAAFLITGRMTPRECLSYIIAQIGGGIAGSLLALVAGAALIAGGTPQVAAQIAPGAALVLETIGTFFLVLVIFGTAVDPRAPRYVYPLAIGLTITAVILAIGPLTGAAINPARAFGPALVSGAWGSQWVYWAGPLAGGMLAGALQHWFLLPGGLPAPEPETA